MKKIHLFVLLLTGLMYSLGASAQAHLGITELEIRNSHSDLIFKSSTTTSGSHFIYANMSLGTFFYYFDKSTGLADHCIQIPNDLTSLNTQVEIYNKKYVVTSKKSWTAYLEGDGMMYIKLLYLTEQKTYYFTYKNIEE
ncbi:MAG: hypothetical protein JWR67_1472 [Mucilaginibacter sp.]|nr:hypothetical protein [Mucilaginibacter sp.]